MTKGQRLAVTAVLFIVGLILLWAAYDSLPRVVKVSKEAIDLSAPKWGALKQDVKFYLGIISIGLGVFFLLGRKKQ